MYQCNLIIVKSSDAVSYLQKLKYDRVPMDLLDGWKTFCSDARCYREQFIGSKVLTLAEYGKYPYELSASDYTCAVEKENDFLDLVRSRQKEDDFTEKVKKICDVTDRYNQLAKEIRQWNIHKNFSEKEKNEFIQKKQELRKLNKLQKEYQKDKVMMYAMCGESFYKNEFNRIGQWNFQIKEYLYYHRLFSRLLRYEPYIFFTYFDEEAQKGYELVNTIQFDHLRIGDLALLCSNDVLKICRK